jgi:hypothetical protein
VRAVVGQVAGGVVGPAHHFVGVVVALTHDLAAVDPHPGAVAGIVVAIAVDCARALPGAAQALHAVVGVGDGARGQAERLGDGGALAEAVQRVLEAAAGRATDLRVQIDQAVGAVVGIAGRGAVRARSARPRFLRKPFDECGQCRLNILDGNLSIR